MLAVELHGEDRGRQLPLCRRAGVRVAHVPPHLDLCAAPTASRSRRTSRARRSACRSISSPPTSGRARSWRTISASSRRTCTGSAAASSTPAGRRRSPSSCRRACGSTTRRRARPFRELLAEGEIDGFMAPRPPAIAGKNIGWLFRDPVAAAKDYYKRTEHFPDHASDRRAADAGREASVAAGGGAEGVRAVEGRGDGAPVGHLGDQGDACRSSRSASPRRAH